jgi:hypothetical protein
MVNLMRFDMFLSLYLGQSCSDPKTGGRISGDNLVLLKLLALVYELCGLDIILHQLPSEEALGSEVFHAIRFLLLE